MKRQWRLRDNDHAVSPVIAVVLMVAITVILAGVVYVMVSALIQPVGSGGNLITIYVKATPDGTNWSLDIIKAPGGLQTSTTFIVIRNVTGVNIIQGTALASFPGYFDTDPLNVVNGGDRILLDRTIYTANMDVEIYDESAILWTGVLR